MTTRSFRTHDGAELAFDDSGSGAVAVIFVHGWQADRTVWRDVVAALAHDLRAISVDLRGSGDSSLAPGPYRLERFATDLRELIEWLRIAPVIVIGHSMGATVALRLAVDAPAMVRGLVLIAPVPASGAGFSAKGAAYLRATAGDPMAAKRWLARTFASAPSEATLERLCAAAAKTSRPAALESFPSWAQAGFAEETTHITAPVLVIAPSHDAPDVQARVAEVLPIARYVELPDAGHYVIVEHPGAIAKKILDFVQSLGPAGENNVTR